MALSSTETQRLARLKAAVAARRGRPGYKRNVVALDKEIAALSAKDLVAPAPTETPTKPEPPKPA